MDYKNSTSGTYYSLEVLTEIFKNEDVSLTIQSYPEEVARRADDEIQMLLQNFSRVSKKYENTRLFDEHNTQLLFKYKLLSDYYALMYIYASKNLHSYKVYRKNLIDEIAASYNGYYDFIPESVINNLSDVELSHIRERCAKIRSSLRVVDDGKFSLIAILKDIVCDDLCVPNSTNLKFYQKNTQMIVPSHMIEILKPCQWIKILKINI
ncbi:hypothetical protein TpMuguga_02g00805 [Theileria parva strain Muguga]|uniref:GINS subunit domain-containing protein n=1 Tax=Theileria parva TaxID=5875 RepID=Q4N434_THEPA|nr:uncharacterized protein TpMuguga_02g00805 [Theileria parva strain Muguga]EAN33089.1 hypothetical protein TpMuguga_02g00805 [Theileria parva strain Muguga]|eukprot:XP_765372.1 hypothetical protein [Theileria parva strain Muguga]